MHQQDQVSDYDCGAHSLQALPGHSGCLRAALIIPDTQRPTAHPRAPQRYNCPRGDLLPGAGAPHAPWCLQRGVPAHTSASCGRAFSCPQSCGACASCPERCLRVRAEERQPESGNPGPGPGSPAARAGGRTLSSPRLDPPLRSREVTAFLSCHHARAARPGPLPASTPAAMMGPLAAPSPAVPAATSAARAQASRFSRRLEAGSPGARALSWAARQDGAGLSSRPDPGPAAERHSPIARRRLERENAARHGPVCKTQPRLLTSLPGDARRGLEPEGGLAYALAAAPRRPRAGEALRALPAGRGRGAGPGGSGGRSPGPLFHKDPCSQPLRRF